MGTWEEACQKGQEADLVDVLGSHQKVEHEMWANEKVTQFAHFFFSIVSENRVQLAAWCSAKHNDLRAKPCIYHLLPVIVGQFLGLSDSPFLTYKMEVTIPPPLNLGCLQLLYDINTKGLTYSTCSINVSNLTRVKTK